MLDTLEIGTVVIETEGTLKGCEFVMVNETEGMHKHFGLRMLKSPVPKAVVLKRREPSLTVTEYNAQTALLVLSELNQEQGKGIAPCDLHLYMNERGHTTQAGKQFLQNSVAPLFTPSGMLRKEGKVRCVSAGKNREDNSCYLWVAASSPILSEIKLEDEIAKLRAKRDTYLTKAQQIDTQISELTEGENNVL